VQFFQFLTSAVDIAPPWVRFGIGRGIRSRLFYAPLASVGEPQSVSELPVAPAAHAKSSEVTAALLTRSLGTGGVEAVVATLARGLPQHGIGTLVVCESGGMTAESLRAEGIQVIESSDASSMAEVLRSVPQPVVVQLHNAPDHAIQACRITGTSYMPVIHTTDINLTPDRWAFESQVVQSAPVSVAVSDTVRDYFLSHAPQSAESSFEVVPNGAESVPFASEELEGARITLSRVLDVDLTRALVFTCLARYDMQKNIPGLVASVLAAADLREDLHLVVAGPVQDWLEYRFADAIRRGHPAGHRIHLMGAGSARGLLAASDAFILDSFFEGWPVAATEAVLAGLPVVAAEVGGAAELVGPGEERGRIFPNPAISPQATTLKRIQRARRRSGDQVNKSDLRAAVLEICDDIQEWRARRFELALEAQSWLAPEIMVRAHADLLRDVVRDRSNDATLPRREYPQ